MKLLLSLFLTICTVLASEYYAKLEPYDVYIVKSSVSGKVDFINTKSVGKIVTNETIIKIDSNLDETELQYTKEKLEAMNNMLEIEQKTYDSIKNLSSKSLFEKDAQRSKILNLKTQTADLNIKLATLEDKIKNKTLKEQHKYIHQINVKVGEYVNPATLLYTAMDFSKGKLEFFIPISNIDEYKDKTIYLNGDKTDLKINKIYQVADDTHISSYRCEIIVPNPNNFSQLYKIEFK